MKWQTTDLSISYNETETEEQIGLCWFITENHLQQPEAEVSLTEYEILPTHWTIWVLISSSSLLWLWEAVKELCFSSIIRGLSVNLRQINKSIGEVIYILNFPPCGGGFTFFQQGFVSRQCIRGCPPKFGRETDVCQEVLLPAITQWSSLTFWHLCPFSRTVAPWTTDSCLLSVK